MVLVPTIVIGPPPGEAQTAREAVVRHPHSFARRRRCLGCKGQPAIAKAGLASSRARCLLRVWYAPCKGTIVSHSWRLFCTNVTHVGAWCLIGITWTDVASAVAILEAKRAKSTLRLITHPFIRFEMKHNCPARRHYMHVCFRTD